MAAAFRSWVEISRKQLRENYRNIRAAVGPGVALMPVVKADAYRHGAIEVSRVLEQEGVQWLAVSNVEEGVALREAGIRARILVMADFLPWSREALLEHGLTPVLHSLDDIAALNELAQRKGYTAGWHLKIDSGMGRLGTRCGAAEIAASVKAAPATELEGLMTHFASVTDFASGQTDEQMSYFLDLAAELAAIGVAPRYLHLGSTGAIAYTRRPAWQHIVRPGHAIYGYTSPPRGPAPPNALSVKPVLTWKASVLAVKEIPAGAPVGYGAIFRAPQDMRIAVLAVGYADGLPHRLSNRGKVIAQGKLAPILGAVSMDVTTIDATQCPGLQEGDAVTLLGSEGDIRIDAQQIARTAGTISYNVLCAISSRVKRVYLDD